MSGTITSVLYLLAHLILTTIPRGWYYYYPHCADKESRQTEVVQLLNGTDGLRTFAFGSKVYALTHYAALFSSSFSITQFHVLAIYATSTIFNAGRTG